MPDLLTSVDLCTFCPRLCSHTCPVSLAEARETVTPQAKMAALGTLRHAPSQSVSSDPLYACTGCGACTDACLHGVSPSTVLIEGRDLVEHAGHGHPALADLAGQHREHVKADALAVSEAVAPEKRRSTAAYAYLPSCTAHRAWQGTWAAARAGSGPAGEALMALGVLDQVRDGGASIDASIAVVSRLCAGYPLYAGGFFQQFRLFAEVFAREVEGYGMLILGCPACTWLLRTQYAAHGVPLRPHVQHLAEFLAPRAADLPIRTPLSDGVYVYHDPCYLGRHLGVYDAPRRLLMRAVQRTEEFPSHRAAARCSGGGGLLPLTAPRTAAAIAAERAAELPRRDRATPAVIVTACTSCERQLGDAAAEQGVGVTSLLALLERAVAT